ncbi:hypothetical protein AgCh_038735 [Apium graveolens]
MMSNNGSGLGFNVDSGSSVAAPIASSNIGFQLLKKHGCKEGTGFGVSEQKRKMSTEMHCAEHAEKTMVKMSSGSVVTSVRSGFTESV